MKKWAIVNCDSNLIEYIYEAEEPTPNDFGGPWGDTSKCEHIEVREDAEGIAQADIEPKEVQVEVGTDYVVSGQVEAKDSNGDPILDSNGDPVMMDDYDPVPVMETRKMAVPKEV